MKAPLKAQKNLENDPWFRLLPIVSFSDPSMRSQSRNFLRPPCHENLSLARKNKMAYLIEM